MFFVTGVVLQSRRVVCFSLLPNQLEGRESLRNGPPKLEGFAIKRS